MAPMQVRPTTGPQIEFPTLVEIKTKLPADCFRAELSTSLYYVARDALFVSALGASAYFLLSPSSAYFITSTYARAALWAAYWYLLGTIFWGIFVLGHDCGHSSFSRYGSINFIVGTILHSSILVPFESWRTTHRLHHKNTGNIDKDEIFYPHRENTSMNIFKRYIVGTLSAVWILYLVGARHLSPMEDIYKNHRLAMTVSLGGWLTAVAAAAYSCVVFGPVNVFFYYFAPLLVFMAWLVVTTFLHHQDIDAPWYGNTEWTYVKGNLSSVDRSYGYGINNLVHSIGTHQIHHLFPKIPHYKLDRATAVFRKEFPQFVRISNEWNAPAFVRNWATYCKYAFAPKGTEYFCYRDAISAPQDPKKAS